MCFLLPPAAASACEGQIAPSPNLGLLFEIPTSGSILVPAGEAEGLVTASLTDPDGDPVTWELGPVSASLALSGAVPRGGWKPGDYTRDLVGGTQPVYRVVETEDTVAPTFAVAGWRGVTGGLDDDPCGAGEGYSGAVQVSVTGVDEPVVFVYELLEADEVAIRGIRFAELLFPAPTSRTADLRLTAVDLSGNTHTETLFALRGCTGCSGGGAEAATFPLLLLATRRRRRKERQPCD